MSSALPIEAALAGKDCNNDEMLAASALANAPALAVRCCANC